jgi:hypothetical protein
MEAVKIPRQATHDGENRKSKGSQERAPIDNCDSNGWKDIL